MERGGWIRPQGPLLRTHKRQFPGSLRRRARYPSYMLMFGDSRRITRLGTPEQQSAEVVQREAVGAPYFRAVLDLHSCESTTCTVSWGSGRYRLGSVHSRKHLVGEKSHRSFDVFVGYATNTHENDEFLQRHEPVARVRAALLGESASDAAGLSGQRRVTRRWEKRHSPASFLTVSS
jgi:hypothetical protein